MAAQFILTGGEGDALTAKPGHPALALLAAGSHPDFRLLERTENDRGTLRAEIVVDQIRELQPLFNTKPTFDGWRVVIIDAADELNRNAANAFLKNLEEPPEKTVFFLVSHSPSRLLPTIRSRCRILRFQPLGDADTSAILRAELPEADRRRDQRARQSCRTVRLGGRCVLLGSTSTSCRIRSRALAKSGSQGDALALSKSLAGKTAQARYEAFIELVPGFIAAEARGRGGASLAHAIGLWEKAHALAAEAAPLAYDPQAVVFELAGIVGELGKH